MRKNIFGLEYNSYNQYKMLNYPQYQPKGFYPRIYLQTSMWKKTLSNLYDYSDQQAKIDIRSISIKGNCRIFRQVNDNQIKIVYPQNFNKEVIMDYAFICQVFFNQTTHKITILSADSNGIKPHHLVKINDPDYYRKALVAVKDLQTTNFPFGYPLSLGNIIKIGKIEFRVIEIKDIHGLSVLKQVSRVINQKEILRIEEQSAGTCKICLEDVSTEDDPLVNPCLCKGSCKFIHILCLKRWVSSKIKKENKQYCETYNFSKLKCQLCNSPFPKLVRLENGTILDIIVCDRPSRPYIILQSISDPFSIFSQVRERTIHVIYPKEAKKVRIGRGHSSELVLTEPAVSRTHAQIKHCQGTFLLRDMDSKFGTMIRFRQQLELQDRIRLQHNRTCFDFKLREDLVQQKNSKNDIYRPK